MILAEKIVYSALLVLIFILLFLYAYLMGEKIKELRLEKKKERLSGEINPLIDKIFAKISGGEEAKQEILLLKKRTKNSLQRELISERIISYSELVSGDLRRKLGQICDLLGLVDYELKNLKAKSMPTRALACRRLGEYRNKKALLALFKALKLNNYEVKYHALQALAKIGDLDYFLKSFLEPHGIQVFSERSLIEIIDSFEGDKITVYKRMIPHHDDYLSSVFIKSAGNGRFAELAPEIAGCLSSASFLRKIAAVKALGQLGAAGFTESLVEELKNPDWRIRAVAARALGEVGNIKALPALREALCDPNWWVRYNAATAIIKMGNFRQVAEEVLCGKDPFAKDMLLYVLKISGQLEKIFPEKAYTGKDFWNTGAGTQNN